jgi:hypothetical protein
VKSQSLSFVLREGVPVASAKPYGGAALCRNCHAGVYEFWRRTAHAGSFESLRAEGREGQTSCLRCHTTAYGQEGGYGGGYGEHSHVGCESCHGPSGEHAMSDDPSVNLPMLNSSCPPCEINRACRECHTEEWSPRFTLAPMLEKVACRDRPGRR